MPDKDIVIYPALGKIDFTDGGDVVATLSHNGTDLLLDGKANSLTLGGPSTTLRFGSPLISFLGSAAISVGSSSTLTLGAADGFLVSAGPTLSFPNGSLIGEIASTGPAYESSLIALIGDTAATIIRGRLGSSIVFALHGNSAEDGYYFTTYTTNNSPSYTAAPNAVAMKINRAGQISLPASYSAAGVLQTNSQGLVSTGVLSVSLGGSGRSTAPTANKFLIYDGSKFEASAFDQNSFLQVGSNPTITGLYTFTQTIAGSINGNAATATKLATSRTLALGGHASGSSTFDGSANTTISVTLNSVGTPGTYFKVTTDATGRVTSGTNPTTLSGFGITDAVPSTTFVRTVPDAVNSTIEFGNYTSLGSTAFYMSVTTTNSGLYISKTYIVNTRYDHTGGAWFRLAPITNSGSHNGHDFEIDIRVATSTLYLRLRRTSGTGDGSATVMGSIIAQQASALVWTATTATATGVTAPTTDLNPFGSGGGGINADTLNGQAGTYYLTWSNFISTPTTVQGYGITNALRTDAANAVAANLNFQLGASSANSNVFLVPYGSASAPSIAGIGQANTGLYFSTGAAHLTVGGTLQLSALGSTIIRMGYSDHARSLYFNPIHGTNGPIGGVISVGGFYDSALATFTTRSTTASENGAMSLILGSVLTVPKFQLTHVQSTTSAAAQSAVTPKSIFEIWVPQTAGSDVANYFKLTTTATTISPILEVVGADTNVDFTLRAKGSGRLLIGSSTYLTGNLDIDPAYSLALGGAALTATQRLNIALDNPSVGANAANTRNGVVITSTNANIASGVTDSGVRRGAQINVAISDSQFVGTLSLQEGMRISYGHASGAGAGTISTARGLYIIGTTGGSSTLGAAYGVHETSAISGTKNFLQSALLLGSESGFGGTEKLYVSGTTRFNGDVTALANLTVGTGTSNKIKFDGYFDSAYAADIQTYSKVAAYNSTASSATGLIKIGLPVSWTSTLITIRLLITNVSTQSAAELIISGYNAPSTWSQTRVFASAAFPGNRIRFAHDGTNCCILIGETTTAWSYPKVIVQEVTASRGSVTSFGTGFTFSLLTSESGLTTTAEPQINSDIQTTVYAFDENPTNSTVPVRNSSGELLATFFRSPQNGDATAFNHIAVQNDRGPGTDNAIRTATLATFKTRANLVVGTDIQAFSTALANVSALVAGASTGIIVNSAANTVVLRSLAAGSSKISVANGNGVSGNPTIDVVEANLALTNIGGTLTVAKGGTGATSLTGYVKASGTSAFTASATIPESDIADGAILARLGSNETISGSWTFSNPVTGGAPTADSHFTTKAWVENRSSKDSVRVASTTNYAPASTTATTITFAVGVSVIDGVTVALNDRILIKNQSTASQNGIYYVSTLGTASVATVLTRTSDSDSWTDLPSALVGVEEGTVNSETLWVCTVNSGGTIGTTDVTWQLVSNKVLAYLGQPSAAPTTDSIVYFTSATATAVATLTSLARSLLDDTTQGAMQSTIGLVPGTNVQAFSSALANLSTLVAGASTGIIVNSAANTVLLRSLAAGSSKISISNGNGVSGNPTIDVVEANLALTNIGGTLSVAKGGTGATTLTGYVKGSGTAALTASATIPESDIADGGVLARLASNETVSGAWSFSSTTATAFTTTPVVGTNALYHAGNFVSGTNYVAPSTALTNLVSLVAGSSTGIIVNSAANTVVLRSLAAGSSKISVSNGNGVSGNPTIDVVEANLVLTNIGGTLTVGKGGTGATSLTGYIKGNGTSAFTASATIPETDIADGSVLARLASNETISGSWTFSNPVTGGTPTADSHLVTKAWVENRPMKDSARVATTANLGTASTTATTLTLSVGVTVIDGVTVALNDRILVKNQSTTSQNGVYYVSTLGTASVSTVLTRTTGTDTWTDLPSAIIGVEEGTANSETLWVCTVNSGGTLGTTAVTFQLVSNKILSYVGAPSASPTTDSIIYFTSATATAVATLTSLARSLLDDTTQSAMQATIGLAIGSNVQAFSTALTNVSSLVAGATTGIIANTGTNTVANRTISAGSSKISISNGNGVSGNPTIDVAEANLTLTNIGGTLTVAKGGTGTTALTGYVKGNGSGSAMTAVSTIPESDIADGSILARISAFETITGNWSITGDWTFAAQVRLASESSGNMAFTPSLSVFTADTAFASLYIDASDVAFSGQSYAGSIAFGPFGLKERRAAIALRHLNSSDQYQTALSFFVRKSTSAGSSLDELMTLSYVGALTLSASASNAGDGTYRGGRIVLSSSATASLTSTDSAIQVGTGANALVISDNVIQARVNNIARTLALNPGGGTVTVNNGTVYHSINFVAGTNYLAPNGSGAALTALNASQLSSGTVPNARLSGTYDGVTIKLNGTNTVFGDQNGVYNVFNAGSFRVSAGSVTGAIVFYAPIVSNGTVHQMTFRGSVGIELVEFTIMFERGTDGTSFPTPFYIVYKGPNPPSFRVRVGYETSTQKTVVVLGETTTVWYNKQYFSIVNAAYVGATDAYCANWSSASTNNTSGLTLPLDLTNDPGVNKSKVYSTEILIKDTTPSLILQDTTVSHLSGRLRVDSNNVYFDSSPDVSAWTEVFRFELDTKIAFLGALRLSATGDATLTSTDHAFQIGESSTANLVIDANEIQTRNNGANTAIFINPDGGNVNLGNVDSTIFVPGKLRVGGAGNATLVNMYTGSASLNFPSINTGGRSSLDITVSGAATGDAVFVYFGSGAPPNNLSFFGHVTAANTVTVFACNYGTSAVDAGAYTFRVLVMRFE